MGDIFETCEPYYLAIGMSLYEYWEGEAGLVTVYRKADELRRDRANQDAWLHGLYVYDALCRVAPVLHAFAKNAKPIPYTDAPYPRTEEQKQDQTISSEQKRMESMKARIEAFRASHNVKMEKKLKAR